MYVGVNRHYFVVSLRVVTVFPMYVGVNRSEYAELK